MMNANDLVRSVFGLSRVNIQPLVDAVEVAYQLVFVDRRNRSSIHLGSDVYSPVAQTCKAKKYTSVVRQIERLCNNCLDRIQKNDDLLHRLVGQRTQEIEGPSDVIFLLACYLKYKKPFQDVLDLELGLNF